MRCLQGACSLCTAWQGHAVEILAEFDPAPRGVDPRRFQGSAFAAVARRSIKLPEARRESAQRSRKHLFGPYGADANAAASKLQTKLRKRLGEALAKGELPRVQTFVTTTTELDHEGGLTTSPQRVAAKSVLEALRHRIPSQAQFVKERDLRCVLRSRRKTPFSFESPRTVPAVETQCYVYYFEVFVHGLRGQLPAASHGLVHLQTQ